MPDTNAVVTVVEALEMAVATGAGSIELDAAALEGHLGAPTPIVPLAPPPANSLELGWLELEEEVLLDEYLLARQTFLETLKAWRASVDLAPLADVRSIFSAAGVAITAVRWDGLAELSDAEIDYAMRAVSSVGARTVTTTAAPAAVARLLPAGVRHGLDVRTTDATPSASLTD